MACVFSTERATVLEGSVCAIGVFDGFHLGHKFLIDAAIEDAENFGSKCVVITFDIDPDEIFAGPEFKKIMSNEQRITALRESGVDDVLVIGFTEELASLDPDEFLSDVFGGNVPSAIHVGTDFHFGCRRSGNVESMIAWCSGNECATVAHDLMLLDGLPVTSSRIRGLLEKGRIDDANRLLGHPYVYEGSVVSGRHAGREMGIRTANLCVPETLSILRDGVYSAYASIDGKTYAAAVNVGIPKTFESEAKSNMEAHILDFNSDIYGCEITLSFISRLRDMVQFENERELISTINSDIENVRNSLKL